MSRRWKSRAAVRAESAWRSSRRASACGCSASSVSSRDIAPSRTEDGLDLEAVVEQDDVRERAGLEEADVAAGEEARRHLGRRAHRVLEGDAERMEIPDGIDHREDRAGERPVLALRRGAILDRPLHVAELEGAPVAAGSGSRHGVRDERDAAGGAPPDEPPPPAG